MNDDDDLEMLRREALRLRFDAGEIAVARVQAAVRARLAARETVSGVLFSWFRPVAAGLMAALVIAVAVAAILSSEPADVLLAGSDTVFANEEYFHAAR